MTEIPNDQVAHVRWSYTNKRLNGVSIAIYKKLDKETAERLLSVLKEKFKEEYDN